LAFEVLLTRLFSLVFQYHFAFLAVSTAILGLGLGALLAGVLGFTRAPERGRSALPWIGLVFGVALPLAALAFTWVPSAGLVPVYILIGMIPFLAAGIFSATLYAHHSQQGAFFYAADLAGAAGGLVLAQVLVGALGAYSAAFFLGGISTLAGLWLARSDRTRLASIALALLLAVGLLINRQWRTFELPSGLASAPPDKVMFHVLSDPAQNARLVDSAWSAFARVDLVATSDPDQMYAFTDAGAGSYMVRINDQQGIESAAWLRQEVEYLPFINEPVGRTLIIGAGAGKDVLQARLAGSQDITAVEINPAIVAMTRRYAAYDGGVLDLPGVHTVVADGRNFVERDKSQYDLIYMNLVYAQASEPGSAALNESYIFTQEAFQAYWHHLSPDGRLAIISHQALEGSRALLTAIAALRAEGMPSSEVLKRSVLVMYPNPDTNQRTSVLILRKVPWTQEEIAAFTQESVARGMQALYVPGVFEITLKGLTTDEITLEQFLTEEGYNLAPTTDDSPFFFNLNPGIPAPLKSLLWVALLAALAYLLIAFLLQRVPQRRQRGHTVKPTKFWWTNWLYFGLLGVGFMLIEVPLIQRAILLVGSSTQALIAAAGGLLVGAAVGSYYSGRWSIEQLPRRVAVAALLVAVLAVLFAFLQPLANRLLLPLGSPWRQLAAALILLPLGMPLGVPFSSGLRLAGKSGSSSVATWWGWNAVTSVLGSVLAPLVAIMAGFHWAMIAGAFFYLLLAGLEASRKWTSV
jgi:spermidine synthase